MYPEPIIEVTNKIYDVFEEDLINDSSKDSKFCEEIAAETISEFMLPKFLEGDELKLYETEIENLYKQCVVDITIASLKEKGLVNTIENEKGETITFLTKKGKSIEL